MIAIFIELSALFLCGQLGDVFEKGVLPYPERKTQSLSSFSNSLLLETSLQEQLSPEQMSDHHLLTGILLTDMIDAAATCHRGGTGLFC